MLRILNCGCGVQSSTILLMSIHGELPKLDAVIFADTGDEPQSVYDWAEFLRSKAESAGIRWVDTKASHGRAGTGSLAAHVSQGIADGKRVDSPPLFVIGQDGAASIIGRGCTSKWKIVPIVKATREVIGLRKGQRFPKSLAVETWLGISADEMQRMKVSVDPWQRFWHPLIEDEWIDGRFAPLRPIADRMRRSDCLAWMDRNGYPEPPRSACWHCPFHSDAEWRRLRDQERESFDKAVEFDRALRASGKIGFLRNGEAYLHRSLKPLSEVNFDDDAPSLFGDECGGVCGV